MHNKKDNIKELFKHLDGKWDTEEPSDGHAMRFMEHLEEKEKKNVWKPLLKLAVPIAATLLIAFGVLLIYTQKDMATPMAMSHTTLETHNYFTGIIEKELAKVEKESTPENRLLVQDALKKMREMEEDYNKLTKELSEKGENKKIIHAMITNLQIRISFLEDVLTQIENIKKIKENYHENNQI